MENKEKEGISWERKDTINPVFLGLVRPLINNLILLIVEEKKKTLEKIEKLKETQNNFKR